jgi:hypothetical protein
LPENRAIFKESGRRGKIEAESTKIGEGTTRGAPAYEGSKWGAKKEEDGV